MATSSQIILSQAQATERPLHHQLRQPRMLCGRLAGQRQMESTRAAVALAGNIKPRRQAAEARPE